MSTDRTPDESEKRTRKEKIKDHAEVIIKRPMGWLFMVFMYFGTFLIIIDAPNTWPIVQDLPIFGVFIIPGFVGIIMLLVTKQEVREIRGRFTNIDVKLDKIDTRLGNIEKTMDTRLGNIEKTMDTRLGNIEKTMDTRLGTIEKTLISMYNLLDERLPKRA